MKNTIITLMLLLGLTSYASDSEIAVVNMEEVYSGYYKTQAQSVRFDKQKEVYKAYSLSLKKQLDSLKKKYELLLEASQNISLKDSVRKDKSIGADTIRMAMRSKEEEIVKYNRSKFEELQKKSVKMREGIIKEIRDVVREVSIINGYKLVIDTSSKSVNGVESVIYFNKNIDITKTISKKLNEK